MAKTKLTRLIAGVSIRNWSTKQWLDQRGLTDRV